MPTSQSNAQKIAQQMIQRHGLQAHAVAQERENLARLVPDAEALSLWRGVQTSISELRSKSSKGPTREASSPPRR